MEDPPAEAFLSEALAAFGDDSDLGAGLRDTVGVARVAPVAAVLKGLAPLRVKLGNAVFSALHTPLEAYVEAELAAVAAERRAGPDLSARVPVCSPSTDTGRRVARAASGTARPRRRATRRARTTWA